MVIVTGGAGFMGSHFCDLLIERGHKILSVDKLTYAGTIANHENVIDNPLFQFIRTDIASRNIHFLMGEKDLVVNFAAETHVDRSIRRPQASLQTNIMGLFNLVYWGMKCNIRRFVHVSTDEVYGPVSEVIGEADESAPFVPTSPYSASKASGDLLVQSHIKTYGFRACIVRPCNTYGPRQYPEKLIPIVITKNMNGDKIPLHGEGKEIREWLYVRDCCEAIYNILFKAEDFSIFNVGSGLRKTNSDVIHAIVKGAKNVVEKIPNRPGNDTRYAIDSTAYKEQFGEIQKIGFDDGLNKTIQWYVEHKNWWKSVDIRANIYDGITYLL